MLHPDQEVPEEGSKTIIPIILSSDKTVYGALSGEAYAWPLYMTSNGFRARMYRVRGSARVRDDRVALKMSKAHVPESLFGANQE